MGVLTSAAKQFSDLLYPIYLPSGQVIFVSIDNKSIEEFGALPWHRTVLAELVDTISQANPRVVGLDLILADSSSEDAKLAQALADAPPVLQPVIGVDATRLLRATTSIPNFGVVLKPTAELETANTQLAHSMFMSDADGVLRRAPTIIQESGKDYLALGIATLQLANAQAMGENSLPVDAEGRLLINFFDLRSVQFSASDVLNHRIDPSHMRDKIVLVGLSGKVAAQSYRTPVSGQQLSSTEINVNLIETFLNHRLLVMQDSLNQVVMVLLLAILAGATFAHFRILTQIGLLIIYLLLYLGYAFAKFDEGIVVQPIYPVLALFLTLIGTAIFRYFSEERHHSFITSLLRRYVPPEDVASLTAYFEDRPLPFGGIRRQASVLALDLSDLEELATSLTPQALIDLLDQYVSLAVGIIFENDGAIVKYTGSAILAAWNLWSDQPNHVQIAVRTAVEIKQELSEFNRRQPKELTIKSGIGIATGHVVAGRIGARHRAEYAIIGEIVGMAERIALKPERSVFIDVTTRERIGDEFDLLEVRPVRLRRKTDPQTVWQLIETNESTGEIINEPEKETTDATIMPSPP